MSLVYGTPSFSCNTVVRIPQDQRRRFLIVEKTPIDQSIGLTPAAFTMHRTMLEYPDDWHFRLIDLSKKIGISYQRGKKVMQELIAKCYVSRNSFLDHGLKRYSYLVFEVPFKQCLPWYKKRTVDFGTSYRRKKLPTEYPPPTSSPPPDLPRQANFRRGDEERTKKKQQQRPASCQEAQTQKAEEIVSRWKAEGRNARACDAALEEFRNRPRGAVKLPRKWLEAVYAQKLVAFSEHRLEPISRVPDYVPKTKEQLEAEHRALVKDWGGRTCADIIREVESKKSGPVAPKRAADDLISAGDVAGTLLRSVACRVDGGRRGR